MFLFLQNLGPFIFVVQSQGLKWISICGGTEVTGSSVLVDVLYQARINTTRLSFFFFFPLHSLVYRVSRERLLEELKSHRERETRAVAFPSFSFSRFLEIGIKEKVPVVANTWELYKSLKRLPIV